MQETSFGYMKSCDLGFSLAGQFEVVAFYRKGEPHEHQVDEIAICVRGSGQVMVAHPERPALCTGHMVKPGDCVHILANHSHWMVPNPEGLFMFIAYKETQNGDD